MKKGWSLVALPLCLGEGQPGPEAAAGLLVLLSGERVLLPPVSLVRWHHH